MNERARATKTSDGLEYPRLYRYCRWNDYARDILAKHEVYLSSPEQWNDPFDCCVRINFAFSKAEKVRGYTDRLVRAKGLSPADAYREASQFFNRLGKDGIRKWEDERGEKLRRRLRSKFASYCLAQDKDSTLMWSHYADSHKGLCIEFTAARPQHVKDFYVPGPVSYTDEYPAVNGYDEFGEKEAQRCLLTKAKCWEYEMEHRIVAFVGRGRGVVSIPDDIITAVYLGCEMSDEDRRDVTEVVAGREHRPAVYEAKKSDSEYQLEFTEVAAGT